MITEDSFTLASMSAGRTCRSGHLLSSAHSVYAARALGSRTVVLIDDYRSRRKSPRHHEAVFSEPRVVSGKTRAACTLTGHPNVWINPVTMHRLEWESAAHLVNLYIYIKKIQAKYKDYNRAGNLKKKETNFIFDLIF